jgi:hypothetical protein
MNKGRLTSLVRLSYLGPEIVRALLAGSQSNALTPSRLLRLSKDLPHDWKEQRRFLGFAATARYAHLDADPMLCVGTAWASPRTDDGIPFAQWPTTDRQRRARSDPKNVHLACGRGRGSICTVAVIPATRTTPSGTSSMWMRTGMRWARRTQVKIGLTVASPCWLACAFGTLMPRAMLPTWPRTIWR